MSDMRVIWKASVHLVLDGTPVTMPKGAEIVQVGVTANTDSDGLGEADAIELWYLCDPKAELEEREFSIVPTGGVWSAEEFRYVGTFATHASPLVWHVVECIR